jgi:hypothetical protein
MGQIDCLKILRKHKRWLTASQIRRKLRNKVSKNSINHNLFRLQKSKLINVKKSKIKIKTNAKLPIRKYKYKKEVI